MKGFTLIEVIIVVGIIAIITLFALNSYKSHRKKVAITTIQQNLIDKAGDIEVFRLKGHAYNSSHIATETEKSSWKEIYTADNKIHLADISYQSTKASSFLLIAKAVNQSKNLLGDCAEMSINYLGEKTPIEKGCW